jgi:hypothetical protein
MALASECAASGDLKQCYALNMLVLDRGVAQSRGGGESAALNTALGQVASSLESMQVGGLIWKASDEEAVKDSFRATAIAIFCREYRSDRSGQASPGTAQSFWRAGLFLEAALSGQPSPPHELAALRSYALARPHAIASGRTLPSAQDGDLVTLDAIVQRLSGSPTAAAMLPAQPSTSVRVEAGPSSDKLQAAAGERRTTSPRGLLSIMRGSAMSPPPHTPAPAPPRSHPPALTHPARPRRPRPQGACELERPQRGRGAGGVDIDDRSAAGLKTHINDSYLRTSTYPRVGAKMAAVASLSSFMTAAAEADGKGPAGRRMAYVIRQHVMEKGMEALRASPSAADEAKLGDVLNAAITLMEEAKQQLGIQATEEQADVEALREAGVAVFAAAFKVDQAGEANKATMMQFVRAGQYLDVARQRRSVADPQLEGMAKHAKFRGLGIMKDLKAGRQPLPPVDEAEAAAYDAWSALGDGGAGVGSAAGSAAGGVGGGMYGRAGDGPTPSAPPPSFRRDEDMGGTAGGYPGFAMAPLGGMGHAPSLPPRDESMGEVSKPSAGGWTPGLHAGGAGAAPAAFSMTALLPPLRPAAPAPAPAPAAALDGGTRMSASDAQLHNAAG